MDKREQQLGQLLVDKGMISTRQLTDALEKQKQTKEFLGKILLDRDLINEKALLEILSKQFGLEIVELEYRYIDWNIVKKFSSSLIIDFMCFPISLEDFTVTIAISNPLDAWAIKKAEDEAMGLEVKLALATRKDIEVAIARYKQHVRWNM